MKKMILFFSHSLTQAQRVDAKKSLEVENFLALPGELQQLWSNIPPYLEDLDSYLKPLKEYLLDNLKSGDVVLVQGDFGATCNIVSFVKSLGGVAVYATTKRDVKERVVDGKVVKSSVFEHIIFRRF